MTDEAGDPLIISIHALRKESDNPRGRRVAPYQNFNPRSP